MPQGPRSERLPWPRLEQHARRLRKGRFRPECAFRKHAIARFDRYREFDSADSAIGVQGDQGPRTKDYGLRTTDYGLPTTHYGLPTTKPYNAVPCERVRSVMPASPFRTSTRP